MVALAVPCGKVERRLLHELAHAACVRHWTDDRAILLSPPPHWPYVWDRSAFLAGGPVEAAAAGAESAVPHRCRLALVARGAHDRTSPNLWAGQSGVRNGCFLRFPI